MEEFKFDPYDSYQLYGYLSQKKSSDNFLKRRYFTGAKRDLRENGTIMIDYSFGRDKVAPFISAKSKGLHVGRDGYATMTLSVPRIGLRESISFDDLDKRLPGEDPFKPLTYAEREKAIISGAYERLDSAISLKEEVMASELLTGHKLTIKEFDETVLNAEPESYDIDFLNPLDTTGSNLKKSQIDMINEAKDSAFYTPAKTWDDSDAHIIKEIHEMITPLSKRNILNSNFDLLIDAKTREALLNNNEFMDLQKLSNYGDKFAEIIMQELGNQAALVGRINVYGKMANVICYEGTYFDEEGNERLYIPEGTAIAINPGAAGHFVYGAVSMYPQGGKKRETFRGERIPKIYIDDDNDTQEFRLYSHPLCVPEQFAGWTVGNVL